MKTKFTKVDKAALYVFAAALLMLGYLFALNGRYEVAGPTMMDKWTKTLIGTSKHIHIR